MRIKLTRDARICHRAGEIVEATASEAAFLISVGSAEAAEVNQSADKITTDAPKANAAKNKTDTKKNAKK